MNLLKIWKIKLKIIAGICFNALKSVSFLLLKRAHFLNDLVTLLNYSNVLVAQICYLYCYRPPFSYREISIFFKCIDICYISILQVYFYFFPRINTIIFIFIIFSQLFLWTLVDNLLWNECFCYLLDIFLYLVCWYLVNEISIFQFIIWLLKDFKKD